MPEEILFRHRRLRTHLHLVEKCRILALMCQVPAIPTTAFPVQSLTPQGFKDCSGRTNYIIQQRPSAADRVPRLSSWTLINLPQDTV
jgi:hypothetical protein